MDTYHIQRIPIPLEWCKNQQSPTKWIHITFSAFRFLSNGARISKVQQNGYISHSAHSDSSRMVQESAKSNKMDTYHIQRIPIPLEWCKNQQSPTKWIHITF